MNNAKLTPVAGMRTEGDDTLFYRRTEEGTKSHMLDIVNLDVLNSGSVRMRPGLRHATATPLRQLWQSPLHKDVFGLLGDELVLVDPVTWDTTPLATVGGGRATFAVLNSLVVICTPSGVWRYDGTSAQRLGLMEPPPPILSASAGGSLVAGTYAVALAWVRDGLVSPLSWASHVDVPDAGMLQITLPMVMESGVNQIRLYITKPDGGELLQLIRLPASTVTHTIPALGMLGEPARFQYMEPMPGGEHMAVWNGRLITASRNVLRFSEPLAYHVHDPRHGFVQMPQRVTFVLPVGSGIYVGQVDHVAHLHGSELGQLTLRKMGGRPPIPGTATTVLSEEAGEQAGGGGLTALWLAENGYAMGSADEPSLFEAHGGIMSGIRGTIGQTVIAGGKVHTVVQ